MATSGTQKFAPAFSDFLLESYARIQVRANDITAEHMRNATMSANLLLSEWAVRGQPQLWTVQELVIPLVQGITTYALPPTTVGILDYFIRQFQMQAAQSVALSFNTTINSQQVTVLQPNHGLVPDSWVSFVIPVAAGGLTLLDNYQVARVIDANTYVIFANNTALSTQNAVAAVVPQLTTSSGSTQVQVVFPFHGLVAGQNFSVEVSTNIGGLVLSGIYTVSSVADVNTFYITAATPAGFAQTLFENSGLPFFAAQSVQQTPTDIVILPISRTDYSGQPNKLVQARPTSVWFDRTTNPSVTLWPVPDDNGPYELHCWCLVQTDDVVVENGIGVQVPWRFNEAFAAGLALKLAMKYPPALPNSVAVLAQSAEASWMSATQQDVEQVSMYISPQVGGYFR